MQIKLISVGNKMPVWVQQGYDEYAKRLPHECTLVLKEIPLGKRRKNTDLPRIIKAEGDAIESAISPNSHIVTLDIPGKAWSTTELSNALKRWLASGQNIALLIGGPDGLSESTRKLAHESWSLSKLTFPHPLVRIMVAEQIYRAWSLIHNHPYHR